MADTPATTGKNHPAYEYARQIWTYLAGGNAERTARILAEPPGEREDMERDTFKISPRTIRYWATHFRWADQADQELKNLAPAIHNHVTRELISASVEGSTYLRQVIAGEIEPNKNRLVATLSALDRTGHMAYTRPSDNSRPVGPTRDYSESVAGLSVPEIMEKLGFAASQPGDTE